MSVDYKIAAFPTLYNGRKFRSRLEARWAAFFDLLNWRFEYEPADLGVWSPDFLLLSDLTPRGILVEVKPITEFKSHVAQKMMSACQKGISTKLLLVGVSPFLGCGREPEESNGSWISSGCEIGWGASIYPGDCEYWEPAFISKASDGSYFDMYLHSWSGGEFSGEPQSPDNCPPWGWMSHIENVRALWAEATNIVQWKGPNK
jgi:hypothetical protein